MKTRIKELSADHPQRDIKVEIEDRNGSILIMPEGYGDNGSKDGFGSPIVLEKYEGKLRLLVWDDINEADPVIIDLEEARETNRKDD